MQSNAFSIFHADIIVFLMFKVYCFYCREKKKEKKRNKNYLSEKLSEEESELEQAVGTCMWSQGCALNMEVGLESRTNESKNA